MAILRTVEFPACMDIPTALRDLADRIQTGQYGSANNLAWVIDRGNSDIHVGLMGRAAAPGSEAHLLLAMGQKRIVDSCF